ncbi:MAG: formylglycine-generating enzyme family protein [Gammaproteobacteria bacterium]|nr:formylglycine-generating enzyme family protein [Gammaproteobacteria bacterium]
MAFRLRWPAWLMLVLLAACGDAGQAPSAQQVPAAAEQPPAPVSASAASSPDGPQTVPQTELLAASAPGVEQDGHELPEEFADDGQAGSLEERIDQIRALLETNSASAARRALRRALDEMQATAATDVTETVDAADTAATAATAATAQGEEGTAEDIAAQLAPLASRAARRLLGWNRLALAHGGGALSPRDLPLLQRWDAEDAEVQALAAHLARIEQASAVLAEARSLIEAGQVLEPAAENAVAKLHQVLRIDPDNVTARHRLARVEDSFLRAAISAARNSDFATAEARLADAGRVRPGSALVLDAATRVVELREQEAQRWKARIAMELAAERPDAAEALLPQLDAATLDERDGQLARAEIERVRRYGAYDAGQLLSDVLAGGGQGPGMIVLPVGRFMMGSPRSEDGREPAEGPRHAVTFQRGFALARTETTVAQFRAFVEATGYRSSAERARSSVIYDERTGAMVERRGVDWRHDYVGNRAAADEPVLHVSWEDASAYVQWLSDQTGARYHLPSEAQFEYALRAGSSTRFPWGDGAPPARVENLTGDGDVSPGGRRWNNAFSAYEDGYWGPAPVARHRSNSFGLSDMSGNVSEWVEDCWHDSYARAPRDGSAWVNPGCARRVVRGGSWGSSPEQTRSAFRTSSPAAATSARVGFRVAREL